jgi:hypothetical protein
MNKETLYLFIALTTFINVSYASFPIADTLEIKQYTLQTEEIKQYHSSLIKMGIDLNSCKCESCRNGIVPLINNIETNSNLQNNILIRLLIIITILSIILSFLVQRLANDFNKSGGIGVG